MLEFLTARVGAGGVKVPASPADPVPVALAGSGGIVTPTSASVGTLTSVALTGADQLVLAANTARVNFAVYNDSTNIVYLGLGTGTTSATNYTTQLMPNAYYEPPSPFTGQVRCFSSAASGNLRVTELT